MGDKQPKEATIAVKKARPMRGIVVSDRMAKTRVARIERIIKHPVVGKYIKRSSKIMFHDETNQSRIGDEVLIGQCRPLSRHKNFELIQIVKQGDRSANTAAI